MSKLEQDIENAIRGTLVIENKQSIHLAVEKIMTLINQEFKAAGVFGEEDLNPKFLEEIKKIEGKLILEHKEMPV